MENDEQTGTNKENGDRLIESRLTAMWWGEVEGGGTEQKRKRTHGHGPQCCDCGAVGRRV